MTLPVAVCVFSHLNASDPDRARRLCFSHTTFSFPSHSLIRCVQKYVSAVLTVWERWMVYPTSTTMEWRATFLSPSAAARAAAAATPASEAERLGLVAPRAVAPAPARATDADGMVIHRSIVSAAYNDADADEDAMAGVAGGGHGNAQEQGDDEDDDEDIDGVPIG